MRQSGIIICNQFWGGSYYEKRNIKESQWLKTSSGRDKKMEDEIVCV